MCVCVCVWVYTLMCFLFGKGLCDVEHELVYVSVCVFLNQNMSEIPQVVFVKLGAALDM